MRHKGKRSEKQEHVQYFFHHRPKKLGALLCPNERERLSVALVESSTDATTESEACPTPLPVGRSVMELPVCARVPFRNHWMRGARLVVGRENDSANKLD